MRSTSNGSSRVFSIVPEVTSLLAGVTITDGNGRGTMADQFGGGIVNQGSLSVSNITLSGNSAPMWGCGILNNNGTLTIEDSTLNGNSALFGGAIGQTRGTQRRGRQRGQAVGGGAQLAPTRPQAKRGGLG